MVKNSEYKMVRKGLRMDIIIWFFVLLFFSFIWGFYTNYRNHFILFTLIIIAIHFILILTHSLVIGIELIINNGDLMYRRYIKKIKIPLNKIENIKILRKKMGLVKLKIRYNNRNYYFSNIQDFNSRGIIELFRVIQDLKLHQEKKVRMR